MIYKIKEKMDELEFDEAEVLRLKKAVEADALEKAGIAKMLNVFLGAKKVFKKLSAVEDEIESKVAERDMLSNEITDKIRQSKDAVTNFDALTERNNYMLQEQVKATAKVVTDARKTNIARVNGYVKEADEKIAQIEKNVKAAQEREQDANTKADLAELRKKELQESLS